MRLAPKPARTTERCKIKPVDPAFRSVSTPRQTKDLPEPGPVDPEPLLGTTEGSPTAPAWSAESLGERLRCEPILRTWNRLAVGAAGRDGSAEQLLPRMLSNVA
jgi:hypothetical protein